MPSPKQFFVTGIGTDIGKTVVSAILVEALGADYWKPVQAGQLHYTDSKTVAELVTNREANILAERFLLTEPLSPHAAAERDGIEMALSDFELPQRSRPLIVEGAGGLLVPLNQEALVVDLIQRLALPVILVSEHYLGSINHTLLSFEALRQRKISVRGLVFVGDPNKETESIILKHTAAPMIGRVAIEPDLTPRVIAQYAKLFREVL